MPDPISEAVLLDAMNWRCAVKKFDTARKIPPATWDTLEEAMRLSPSSFGLQPWKFIVVDDPEVRQKLRDEGAYGQAAVSEASHLVVLCYQKDLGAKHIDAHLDVMKRVRGISPESADRSRAGMLHLVTSIFDKAQVNCWSSRQVYIAFGVLMTSAAMLGIDACPIEGIDPADVDRILNLADKGVTSLALCALGYRAAEDGYSKQPKVRFDRADVIEHV